MKKLSANLLIVVLCCYCNSCKKIDLLIEEIEDTTEAFTFAIDEATREIQYGLQDVEEVLENLGDRFSEEQANLVYRTDNLINVLFGELVVSAQCLTDFTAQRAIHYLQLLKAEFLTGSPPPPPIPFICNYSISSLDLNAPIETRTLLRAFGGDFLEMTRDSFQAFFMPSSGSPKNISNKIKFQSNYEFTVDLSSFSDKEIEKWESLILYYNEQAVSAFSIIKKRPKPPIVRQVEVTPGIFGFIPPHIKNGYDKEFGGNADVEISVEFLYNRKQVGLRIRMHAQEHRYYWFLKKWNWETAAGGQSPIYWFYTADHGYYIKGIVGPQYFSNVVRYHDYDTSEDTFNTRLGEARVMGDGPGDDAGIHTGVDFNFSYRVPIVVEEDK